MRHRRVVEDAVYFRRTRQLRQLLPCLKVLRRPGFPVNDGASCPFLKKRHRLHDASLQCSTPAMAEPDIASVPSWSPPPCTVFARVGPTT